MIRQLTEAYVAAFTARDLHGVGRLLAEDVALEDPVPRRIEGKPTALAAVGSIVGSSATLDCSARNILVAGATA